MANTNLLGLDASTRQSRYTPSDVILVCHSLACATMAAWAEKYGRTIKAALLVAPADTEEANFPAKAIGFSPIPLQKLTFPSIVVASTNDEYVSLVRSRYFTQCWGYGPYKFSYSFKRLAARFAVAS